jgi:hypothetical protein
MFKKPSVDPSIAPVHKTSLSRTELNKIESDLENIDMGDSFENQYRELDRITRQLVGKFENDHDDTEIKMIQTTLDAILNMKKRGSKPYEIINVLLKVLKRVTDVSGGRRKKRTKRRKTRKLRRL